MPPLLKSIYYELRAINLYLKGAEIFWNKNFSQIFFKVISRESAPFYESFWKLLKNMGYILLKRQFRIIAS